MAGGIVMLEGHVRMSLQEVYHLREEDVFRVAHSVEIAYNDNKLSPMMLLHTPPDHDGPSTSKSILLQSTGFGVTLIPSTINKKTLHMVCHCEDYELSVLSPCSAVLGVSQYEH